MLESNLLATKLHRPPLPAKWVQRPQFSQRLNEGLELNRLPAGQQGLSEQLSRQQRSLLAHVDARHRETLQTITAQLEADQLETVELLYDLVDRQQLAQWELDEITTLVQQALVKLKDTPNAAYWGQLLAAAEETGAVDQKLKLILPLIPCLLEYELELRADTLPALRQVWGRLRAKIKR